MSSVATAMCAELVVCVAIIMGAAIITNLDAILSVFAAWGY